MKRSEINKALKDMHDLIKKFHVSLPPFCEWTPEEWKTKGKEYDVREHGSELHFTAH